MRRGLTHLGFSILGSSTRPWSTPGSRLRIAGCVPVSGNPPRIGYDGISFAKQAHDSTRT